MKPAKWEIKDNKLYISTFCGDFIPTELFDEAIQLNNGLLKVRKENLWGCLNNTLDIIIPIQYIYIYERNYDEIHRFILCGRDGQVFKGIKEWDFQFPTTIDTIFTGVYDLYDIEGNCLFGGFSDFIFNLESKLYLFLFGRKWIINSAKHWTDKNEYEISDTYGKWFILNEDFVIPFKTYCRDSFKGKKIRSTFHKMYSINGMLIPETLSQNFHYKDSSFLAEYLLLDLPNNTFFDKIVKIENEYIIVSSNKKQRLISLKTMSISNPFDSIEIVSNEYAVVSDWYPIGLLRDTQLVLSCEYNYITVPVNNWCFAFMHYPTFPNNTFNDKYYGMLINLNKNSLFFSKTRLAIENIDLNTLEELLSKNAFKLISVDKKSEDDNKSDIDSISLYNDEGEDYIISEVYQMLSHMVRLKGSLLTNDSHKFLDYYRSAKYYDELKHPEDYSPDDNDVDFYGIEDALDGEWDAYSNID